MTPTFAPRRFTAAAVSILAGLIFVGTAQAQAPNTPDPSHPGKAIYDRACAMCHANPTGRAATFGQITGTRSLPRQIQLALHYNF